MEISGFTATDVWLQVLDQLTGNGKLTGSRIGRSLELINAHITVPMHKPIVTVPRRKLGYRFMFAEAHWILTGDNRVKTIAPFSKTIADYSDNGETFFGAYGPKIYSQLEYVVEKLCESQDSRQAVINIWRESPPKTKDYPCTLSAQFIIRGGLLHCIDNMRSSDAWMGFPYDVFNFTMLSGLITLCLRRRANIKVELGNLYMNLGSLHLYEEHWELAKQCLQDEIDLQKPRKFRYSFFLPLKEWSSPGEFLDHLDAVAAQAPGLLKSSWCHCIGRGDHNK